jgi:hypothetical protein
MGLAQYGSMAEFSWIEEIEQLGDPDERRVERTASVLEPVEVQTLIDLLRAPLLAQDYTEAVVLRALELNLDRSFETVGAVVRWATSSTKALALELDLESPGPWSAFEERESIALPAIEGLEFKSRGALEVKGSVLSFDIQEDVAYLPAGAAGLRLVNVANPSAPKLLSTVKVGPYAMACAVSGRYAYVAAGPVGMPESYLRVVEVGDPQAAKVVGFKIASLTRPSWAGLAGRPVCPRYCSKPPLPSLTTWGSRAASSHGNRTQPCGPVCRRLPMAAARK